jgi:hypothetical protein
LTLDNEGIATLLNDYDRESKALREELLRICWHMRGGVSYEEAFMMSQQERELIGKIINDNMETTKKSGMPFF